MVPVPTWMYEDLEDGTSPPSLRFLSPDDAWTRLRAASFWSTAEGVELEVRYGVRSREAVWTQLRHAFTQFSPAEQAYWHDMTRHARRIWQRTFGFAFPHLPRQGVALGRWPSTWDWGYPYTVSDMIVVPSDLAASFSPVTFLHECLHLWQRAEPDLFRNAYAHAWNFRYLEHPLQVPPTLRKQWVSNPDGWDNAQWIWYDSADRPWCLVCLLDPRTQTPLARAYAVDLSRHCIRVDREALEADDLARVFGNLGQLYHPHEILAKHLERWLLGRTPVPPLWHDLFRQLLSRSKASQDSLAR